MKEVCDIAIIGIACRFPGANNYDQFWNNLILKKDTLSEIPIERWDWKKYFGDPLIEANKSNSNKGGFIADIDKFDSKFFKISPYEASLMDPQQRIMLELAWTCIEDAGYSNSLSGSNTGVFIGVCHNDYKELQERYGKHYVGYAATGTGLTILSNRISYFFNFHGPSIVVDTACSSSLVSVIQGCRAIADKDCELSLVGGINYLGTESRHLALSGLGMLSPKGRCKTFDIGADGYVRSEGAGLVLLKALNAAKKDNDSIYAVIKGGAINHGGRARTLTSPNAFAQSQVIKHALQNAGINPKTISYIETHGTGTPIGDPIEIAGLKRCFNKYKIKDQNYCGLGTVKTNIGHLEGAAGIAGIIKTILSLKHKILPGLQNFDKLNPKISLKKSPFYVVTKTKEWKKFKLDGQLVPLRAGVSSFGFGGTNAHIILEEYNEDNNFLKYNTNKYLFVLSAETKEQLNQYIKNYIEFLTENKTRIEKLDNLIYTLQLCRKHMRHRLAFIITDIQDLLNKLLSFDLDYNNLANTWYQDAEKSKALTDKHIIEESIRNQDMYSIAKVWVSGQEIAFQLLYHNNQIPKKMHLPTYPFNKEKHWLVNKNINSPSRPLSDNTIDKLKDQSLIKQSSVNNFYLKEYLINKDVVLSKSENSITYYSYKQKEVNIDNDTNAYFNDDQLYIGINLGEDIDNEFSKHFMYKSFNDVEQVKIIDVKNCNIIFKIKSNIIEKVFYFTKYLLRQIKKHNINFIFVLKYYQLTEKERIEANSLSGYIRSLHEESTKIKCKLIVFEDHYRNYFMFINKIVLECNFKDLNSFEVTYKNNRRYEKFFDVVKIELSQDREYLRAFKNDAVYLISGGMGGIGKTLAKYIASKYKSTIILLGRSKVDHNKEEFINYLKKLGSEVVYYSVDITNKEDVINITKLCKAKYKKINGVFHLAGFGKLGLLQNKTLKDIYKTIFPKIKGIINLDLATQREQLDFFISFSSIASVFGIAGQVDYALANSYLDYYSQYRSLLVESRKRYGKSLSINWPYWLSGGMHITDDSIRALEIRFGLVPISENLAMDILEILIKTENNFDQILVHYGNRNYKIELDWWLKQSVKVTEYSQSQYSRNNKNLQTLSIKITKLLSYIIAEAIQVDPESLNVDEVFSNYGMNSLTILEITNNLEKIVGKIPKTLFFEYKTIRELTDYLIINYQHIWRD